MNTLGTWLASDVASQAIEESLVQPEVLSTHLD